ncbi:5'-methylthioadenosine/S-adenosylhomocysteine nucleosidase [Spirochaetia bacterium]|nr:5'-methylthioadenosine/S-adenosylhomocysteine nucleosidase [Spirochaetia bacterium]
MLGIIGAMEEEVEILHSCMKIDRTVEIGGFKFFYGKLEEQRVVLLKCGIGKVNAAVGCALMIHVFLSSKDSPQCVINTGCAGGINPKNIEPELNFGDVVISTKLVQHDFDITAFGHEIGQIPGLDRFFTADEKAISKVIKAIDALKRENKLPNDLKYVQGLIASGDVFMSDGEHINKVVKLFPDLRAVEMEGAAIAQTCTLLNTPFVVLRAMSDIAGEESPVKFDEYLPAAAKHTSEIVKYFAKIFHSVLI